MFVHFMNWLIFFCIQPGCDDLSSFNDCQQLGCTIDDLSLFDLTWLSILKTVISLWKTWLLFQWDIHFKNFDLKLPPPSAYCLWYRQLIIGYQYSIQIFHNLVTHFIIFQHIGTIRWLAVNKNWPFLHFCWVMHDLHSPTHF